MGIGPCSFRLARVACIVALACAACLAVPAIASPAASWQSGPLVESQDSNCITGQAEYEAGTFLSYYADPTAPPQTGQVFYVAIDLTGIGNTCAGIYSDINLILPSGLSLAISAAHPVICYLGFPGASSYSRDTADCPQSLPLGPYGYSIDPLHANPPFWPLPQGGTVEVQVPVVASSAGVLQLQGYVQLADGEDDPTLSPTLEMIVDDAGAQNVGGQNEQIGITYQTPSSITSNTFQTTGTYAGTTTATMTGFVWNQDNTGSAIVQLAYPDSAGNCNSPGAPFVNYTVPGGLAHPDSRVDVTIQDLFPDVAYCWRLGASITSGPVGTYYGNWQYFVTSGAYHPNWTPTEPPAATATGVSECQSNGAGCATSNCNTGSTCQSGGSLGGLSHTLHVAFAGSGTGTVKGPLQFSCTKSCSGTFAPGSKVALTPTAGAHSKFVGWSGGGCSGTGTCTVTMNSNQSVTAMFASTLPSCTMSPLTRKVALKRAKTGKHKILSGTVTMRVKCNQATTAKLAGTLTQVIGKSNQTYTLSGHGSVKANTGTKLVVNLPLAALNALTKSRANESVKMTLTATDANGTAHATASIGHLRS
jgi:hypothetical protein